MKKKSLIILSCLLIFSCLFQGCTLHGGKQYQYVLGYSTPSLQNPFWVSVTKAMQQKADEMGVGLTVRDAQSDTAKQAADIEDLIEQKVSVLLITPYDSVSLAPVIKLANKANIPVIIVDIGINAVDVTYESLIITDNYLGGRMVAQWMIQYFKDNNIKNPKVGIIEAQLGAENARERHQGFIDIMNQSGIQVVLDCSANSQRDQAMQVMEDFLQTYPNLTAVFAENDDMALGALQAVKQSQAGTIIAGFDGIKDAYEEIRNGSNLKADISQQPEQMGSKAIELAQDVMQGKEVDKEVQIVPILITKDSTDYMPKN
jgi:ABC-type sugar transport system, periplasmic component